MSRRFKARKRWSPPAEFHEYVIERPLAEGGMGHVHVARDRHLDRQVAIKFVTTSDDPVARARFRNEAKAIARLQHPNVVSVYRVGEVDGHPYVAYELVSGTPLDQLPMPVSGHDLVSIALDLARGLAAAHRHGILHRDIKPSNAICSDEGLTKLLDFGLAKLTTRGDHRGRTEETATRAVTEPAEGPAPKTGMPTQSGPPGFANSEPLASTTPIAATTEAPSLDLTDENAIMGTPLFLAPELWRGDRASEATDIYAYGAVLYLLATGEHPVQGATILELGHAAVHGPPITLADATLPDGRLGLLIESCLARDPRDRPESADEICAILDEIASKGRKAKIPEGNPYRGLLAFQAEHRDLFFGRDMEISSILDRLRVESLVIVAGDSGVGKSSLCRAGVIPEIREGALGGDRWIVRTVVPGKHPMSTIAEFFREALSDSETAVVDDLADEWTDIGRHLGSARSGGSVLLFIDQLEELITLSDPDEAAKVGSLLERAISPNPEVKILCTVRSDFLTRVASLPGLRRALTRSLYLLPPLSPQGVRLAIEGPARAHGFAFEDPEIVNRLCSEVSGTTSLPLLQFALAELWVTRDEDRKVIPKEALDAIGGLGGALGRHADEVLRRLRPQQRQRARAILTRLTSRDHTRLRRTTDELGLSGHEDRAVLDALVDGRLLVATEGDAGPQFEVAHEALLRDWKTLRDWLNEDRHLHSLLQRCEDAAREWQQGNSDLLWERGLVERSRDIQLDDLTETAQEFLRKSRRAVQYRKIARVGTPLAFLASVVASLLLYSLLQDQRREREVNSQLDALAAELASATAETKRIDGLRQAALALFDSGKTDQGNEAWSVFLQQAQRHDSERLREIESAAENTYLLDPGRRRGAQLLAEVLLERAQLAESYFQWREAENLVHRAQRISRESASWWTDPVTVQLSVSPADTFAELERFDTSGHPWTPVKLDAGSDALSLAPGSYRFGLTSDGHVSAFLPFEVRRREPVALKVALPEAARVPDSVVFVPAGRTFLGSDHPEEMRRYLFRSAPMRSRAVGSFLIGRHEVTFSDYVEYLESLGGDERVERFPRSGLWGVVDFERVGPRQYRFRDAETGSVDMRSRKNWRRLPLMGISAQDAVAYTRWLNRTGKLPGARLCQVSEWVRAARGADRRTYPHSAMLEDGEANTYYEGGLNRAAPVGEHKGSNSPFGVLDMAGNVFEIVVSGADEYFIAGGSYEYTGVNATVVNAAPAAPDARGAAIGLRVCADVPDTAP